MTETMKGTAIQLLDSGLEVAGDPRSTKTLGQPGGMVKFYGTKRGGGLAPNQKSTVSNAQWVAPNGKKIYIDPTTFDTYVDGDFIGNYRGRQNKALTEKFFSGLIDTNGRWGLQLGPEGEVVTFRYGTGDRYTFTRTNTTVPFLCRQLDNTRPDVSEVVVGGSLYRNGVLRFSTSQQIVAAFSSGNYVLVYHLNTTSRILSATGLQWNGVSYLTTSYTGLSSVLSYPTLCSHDISTGFGTLYHSEWDGSAAGTGTIYIGTISPAGTAVSGIGAALPAVAKASFPPTAGGYSYYTTGTNVDFYSRSLGLVTDSGQVDIDTRVSTNSINPSGVVDSLITTVVIPPSGVTNRFALRTIVDRQNYPDDFVVKTCGLANHSSTRADLNTQNDPGQSIMDFGDVPFCSFPGRPGSSYIVGIPFAILHPTNGRIGISRLSADGVAIIDWIENINQSNFKFQNISQSVVRVMGSTGISLIDTNSKTFAPDFSVTAITLPIVPTTSNVTGYKMAFRSENVEGLDYEAPGGSWITPQASGFNQAAIWGGPCSFYNNNTGVYFSTWINYKFSPFIVFPAQVGTDFTQTTGVIPPMVDGSNKKPESVPLISGSAYNPTGKLDYPIQNQYPQDLTFFILFGTVYAFDGQYIQIAQTTGGGIIQGLSKLAEADGLHFIAAGATTAFFWSPLISAFYTFDGGRSINRLTDGYNLPADLGNYISGAAYQTSNGTLYLPTERLDVYTLKDGQFSVVDSGHGPGETLNIHETTSGPAFINQATGEIKFIRQTVLSSTDTTPSDPLIVQWPYYGIGENQKINVHEIVFTLRVRFPEVSQDFTVKYFYQTEAGENSYTDTHTLIKAESQSGIYRFSYRPPVTAVLSFSVGLEFPSVAGDVVILDSVAYTTPDGPACYGLSQTVNGG